MGTGESILLWFVFKKKAKQVKIQAQRSQPDTPITEFLESCLVPPTWGWSKIRTIQLTMSTQPRFRNIKLHLGIKIRQQTTQLTKTTETRIKTSWVGSSELPSYLAGGSRETSRGNGQRATYRVGKRRRGEGRGEEAKPGLSRTEGQAIDGLPLWCSSVKTFLDHSSIIWTTFWKGQSNHKNISSPPIPSLLPVYSIKNPFPVNETHLGSVWYWIEWPPSARAFLPTCHSG